MFNSLKRALAILFVGLIASNLLLQSCAQMASPPGGKKDTLAPKIISSSPLHKSKNFKGKKIAIVHDKTTYGQGLADVTRATINKGGLKAWKASTNNARSETMATSPAFREAYRRRRCIIPVTSFTEWTGPKGSKTVPRRPLRRASKGKPRVMTQAGKAIFVGFPSAPRGARNGGDSQIFALPPTKVRSRSAAKRPSE